MVFLSLLMSISDVTFWPQRTRGEGLAHLGTPCSGLPHPMVIQFPFLVLWCWLLGWLPPRSFFWCVHFRCIKGNYLFLIEGWLLYNHGLPSATHQHGLAIGVYVSPPSWAPLPPPMLSHPCRLLQRPSVSSLSHIANFHWLSVLHMVVYKLPQYPLHSSHPLFPPPPLSMSLLSMSAPPLLLRT